MDGLTVMAWLVASQPQTFAYSALLPAKHLASPPPHINQGNLTSQTVLTKPSSNQQEPSLAAQSL